MNARIQAAAQAMADHNGWTSYTDAQKALAAADAVMFSDEAFERAENAVYSLAAINAPEIVRTVVAALKGDA